MTTDTGRKAAFFIGVRALLPMHLGVAPFGVIYGVLALQSGISPGAAIAMSSIVFAGSAQFLLAQLIAGGAPFVLATGAVGLINLGMPFIAHRWRPSWRICRCGGKCYWRIC